METLRGVPEKGVRFSPKGRKACSLFLTSLPIQRGLGASQSHVHPFWGSLWSPSPPAPLSAPFHALTQRSILQWSQRRDIYKAIPHALSPPTLLTRLRGRRQGLALPRLHRRKNQDPERRRGEVKPEVTNLVSGRTQPGAQLGPETRSPPPTTSRSRRRRRRRRGGRHGGSAAGRSWVPCWVLPLTSCVTLDQWLRLSA